jgi:hypothetical protein
MQLHGGLRSAETSEWVAATDVLKAACKMNGLDTDNFSSGTDSSRRTAETTGGTTGT